jgi:hypothetical protein
MCMTFWSVRTFFGKCTCWTWCNIQHVLNRWYLHCLINYSHTSIGWHSAKSAHLLWTHRRCACYFLDMFGLFMKNWHVVELSHFSNMFWICVVNSSHTSKLTFCTFVMDTLKMFMWHFGSVWTFFKNFTCSWTWSFPQQSLNRWCM